jgi:DNA polymerase-3 subunit alpha
MGFAGYFLIVADFINWAKANGIRVGPGRGSGAGSMVAYAMRITDLDPLVHGLLFERFLNPERVSMPDFDVDFDERRRGEVINYVTNKYGNDYVAQIVTYGTIKTKQALKDAARLLDMPFSVGDRLTKALPPPVMAQDISVAGIFNEADPRYKEAGEFRELIARDPEAAQAVELAKGIEGLKRQWGVHAAGVIMSSQPLDTVIPIMKRPSDGAIITQFEYPVAEELGLVKMDFLGLRNLTIIDDALENIVANGKSAIVLEDLSLDDLPTYELLARGDTLGVFQLDGGPMRGLLKLMRPDNFEDISAVLALYRPGPMGVNSHINYALRKNKEQEIVPIHPELDEPLSEILGNTFGLIVYQEQVMAAAQKVAGYSLGGADILRRVMGKKKRSELEHQQKIFFGGMTERGFSKAAQESLWQVLESFADYAFNKAHTAAYGLISYWTGYLKANYPAEYMAALLQSTRGDKAKMALYLNECRHMGITVLPPDVNESAAKFTAVGNDIRFGLSGVRNVGDGIVDSIVATRQNKGNYDSFTDFLDKVPANVCNKRTIESLIKAGAFDASEKSRKALMLIHEPAIESVISVKRQEAEGIFDLFSGFGTQAPATDVVIKVPKVGDWDKSTKLEFEREMLGLYVSDHPLAGLEPILAASSDTTIASLSETDDRPDGSQVKVAGLIAGVQVRVAAKSGNQYAIIELEDMSGSIEVSFFGDAWLKFGHALKQDAIISITGRIQRRDESISLSAKEMTIPDLSGLEDTPIILTLAPFSQNQQVLGKLAGVLANHQGLSPVHLAMADNGGRVVVLAHDRFRVNKTSALYSDVKAVLGMSCVDS